MLSFDKRQEEMHVILILKPKSAIFVKDLLQNNLSYCNLKISAANHSKFVDSILA